jgi:ribose transport system substrate-binding protein
MTESQVGALMAKLNILVSLITKDNDYQQEQAAAAERAARLLDVSIQIVYAGNDAVNQTQQLVKHIQNPSQRLDAILAEPVGTGMPQVAAAAAAAGIGWAVLNREVDYVAKLRESCGVPVFAVNTDQEEIGRIQGKQFAVLFPQGGTLLYIEGPSTAEGSRLRALGMNSVRPEKVSPKVLRGDWTEQSGHRAVTNWLSLSTSQQLHVGVIGCQNDAMALGARRAFEEVPDSRAREDWLSLPFTGCDGLPNTGQEWVRRGILAATVVVPPTMGLALEIMAKAIRSGTQPPQRTLSKPTSCPTIAQLQEAKARTIRKTKINFSNVGR